MGVHLNGVFGRQGLGADVGGRGDDQQPVDVRQDARQGQPQEVVVVDAHRNCFDARHYCALISTNLVTDQVQPNRRSWSVTN